MPDVQRRLNKYLADAHAMEAQAIFHLLRAPRLVGDRPLAEAMAAHLGETVIQQLVVRDRLESRRSRASALKDFALRVNRLSFLAFTAAQADASGKITVDSFAYEHFEIAAYELLALIAEAANDPDTAAAARRIGDEERAMAGRIESRFDAVVEASLNTPGGRGPAQRLDTYLRDAHAVETEARALLERSLARGVGAELRGVLEQQLEQTRDHQRRVAEQLAGRGREPSPAKDGALRAGGVFWAAFWGAQPGTAGKLAVFTVALDHLQVASYELLRRVAARAGDDAAAGLAADIAGQERAAAADLAQAFPQIAAASLRSI